MPQFAGIVEDYDVTARLYDAMVDETHDATDAFTASGEPVTYQLTEDQRAAAHGLIADIRAELADFAGTVSKINKDDRFSDVGRGRVRVERARLAAANIRKRANLITSYTELGVCAAGDAAA